MKKNVLVFGLISGIIVSAFMFFSVMLMYDNPDFEGSMLLGYASMLAAFSFVFVGIKNYRDKYSGGYINFGKAFKLGLYITLVASTMYVATWLVEYYLFIPDFMERYSEIVMNNAEKAGATAAELAEKRQEMEKWGEMYKNPVWVILFTYMEILPVGLVVSLISALILKKKPQ